MNSRVPDSVEKCQMNSTSARRNLGECCVTLFHAPCAQCALPQWHDMQGRLRSAASDGYLDSLGSFWQLQYDLDPMIACSKTRDHAAGCNTGWSLLTLRLGRSIVSWAGPCWVGLRLWRREYLMPHLDYSVRLGLETARSCMST